jgi:hypothetical protein
MENKISVDRFVLPAAADTDPKPETQQLFEVTELSLLSENAANYQKWAAK